MANTGQIVKAKIEREFSIIPNNVSQSKDLNLEEKGLLLFLLSLPNDWVLYKGNLHELVKEKEGTVDRVFRSLQNKGYILSVRQIGKDGKFKGWNHIVYEQPTLEIRDRKSPTSTNADIGESSPIQIHTDYKELTKDKNVSVSGKKVLFVPPTEDEVIAYFAEKGYTEDSARKAFEYYNEGDWFDKNGVKVRNWKQKMMSVWFKDENKKKEPYRSKSQFRDLEW